MENKTNYRDLYFELVQRINKFGPMFKEKVSSIERAVKRIGKTKSRFKVRFLNPTYTVNEEDRTVLCHLPYKVDTSLFDEHTIPLMKDMFEGNVNVSVGVASCDESDVFNAEEGKSIAYTKAQIKTYSHVHTCLGEIYSLLDFQKYYLLENMNTLENYGKSNIKFLKFRNYWK